MIYVDDKGRVIAMKNTKVKAPWLVLESGKFPGRFYFFNTEDKRKAWTADRSILDYSDSSESKFDYSGGEPALGNLQILKKPRGSHDDGDASKPSPGSTSTLPQVREERAVLAARDLRRLLVVSSKPNHDSFDSFHSQLAGASVPDDLRVVGGLGQGGFGVVVHVKHVISGRDFAMKVIDKQRLRRRRDRERLQVELHIAEKMSISPFCQGFYEFFETKTSVFVVMDLQRGGDLFFHLMNRIGSTGAGFTEDETRVILAELCLALEHVHGQGFIHRDIKVENVMLDADGHVKLIDFGLACEVAQDVVPLSPTGSIIYMAPELINDHSGGRHTDWWAVGILAFELLTGRCPWSTTDDKIMLQEEINSGIVELKSDASPQFHEFVEMLLRKDYRWRLGTKSDTEVKMAPFFATVDWNKMKALECAPALNPPAGCICVCPGEAASAAQKYFDLAGADRNASPMFSMGLRVASKYPKRMQS